MPCDTTVNYVKEIYAPFTDEEISAKWWNCLLPLEHVQRWRSSIRHLRGCMPPVPIIRATGTSPVDYPTPGGVRMVNEALIHYVEMEYEKLKIEK